MHFWRTAGNPHCAKKKIPGCRISFSASANSIAFKKLEVGPRGLGYFIKS